MFSYYGSKSKVINYYPAPKHDIIVEPFAGSARYALKYFDREVIINDKYEVELANWIYGLSGQKIVCESSDASWLPFEKLKQMNTLKGNTIEGIYCIDRNMPQITLF